MAALAQVLHPAGCSRPVAVTTAANRIDRLLESDPVGNGRHLSEGLDSLTVSPLRVNYTIDFPQRHVQVTWVRFVPC